MLTTDDTDDTDYGQDRGIAATERPFTPARSAAGGEREEPEAALGVVSAEDSSLHGYGASV